MSFYVFYLFRKSKNKQDFISSPYNQSVAIAVILFFISFISINAFLNDPPRIVRTEEAVREIQALLKEDDQLLKNLDQNFTQTSLHYEYVEKHFKIPGHWKNEYGETVYRDDLTALNYYLDKLNCQDTLYLNNANLSLGIIYYNKNNPSSALMHLNAITEKKFPLCDAYKATVYLEQKDTLKAIQHFRIASEVNDIFKEHSSYELIRLLNLTGKEDELFSLLQNPAYNHYFSTQMASKLYFQNDRLPEYFSCMVLAAFKGVKFTGFLAAFSILFIWGYYLVRLDIFEKENKLALALVLLSGMAFSIVCFYLYDFLEYRLHFSMNEHNVFVYSVLGIGMVEELVKIIPLLLLLLLAPKVVSEPYDYLLYAGLSALGFSFMENLMYFDGDLNNIIHGRGLTSVPGHIINSCIVAYGLVLARYRYKTVPAIALFAGFFFLGALNHGLYDYFLFKNLVLFFILAFVVSVSIWIIIINNCLNNSPSFDYLIASRSNRIQMALSLSLLSILILEYTMVAWENGPTYANEKFNGHLIMGGIFITYYSSRLTNMDLVRGYWAGIPFKTISELRADAEFNLKNFLLRFFSGDTFPHTFVQLNIQLQADPMNEKLVQFFTQPVKGIISDRLVVTCLSKKGTVYSDPYWFRIDTVQPVNTGGALEECFLFRFEEARPSFDSQEQFRIYLFAFKNPQEAGAALKREDLRALGAAWIKKERK